MSAWKRLTDTDILPVMPEKRLLEFYGRECSHCHTMKPLIKKVEEELGVHFEKFEVWHDPENAHLVEKYDRGHCGGVPFYANTATGEWICGTVDYETFKAFAQKS